MTKEERLDYIKKCHRRFEVKLLSGEVQTTTHDFGDALDELESAVEERQEHRSDVLNSDEK